MQTPITTSELAILGATQFAPGKMWRPTRSFDLNLQGNNANNAAQQIKAVILNPGTGQGVPQPVQNVTVSRSPGPTGQYRLTVSFTTNPNDPNYQATQVVLNQTGGNPVAIGSGASSPIVVMVDKRTVVSSVIAQSVGRFGSSALSNHPSIALSLK